MSALALGLIETRGLVAAIEAADAAAKAATVTLVSAELLGAGIVTLRLQGELGAVQAAVEAGAQAAKRIGEVLAVRVIPRPVAELAGLAPSHNRLSPEQDPDFARAVKSHTAPEVRAPEIALPAKIGISVPSKTAGTTGKRNHTAAPRQHKPRPKPAPRPIERPATAAPATVTAPRPAPATISHGRTSQADLENMSVVRLRQYARAIKNLPIQGRQISMANKTQLMDAIRQVVTFD